MSRKFKRMELIRIYIKETSRKSFSVNLKNFSNSPYFREADGDDDIIFEDFARLRLKGETDAWLRGSNSIDLFDATKRKIFQNGATQLIL